MANPLAGEVEIWLDGRPHVARLTLGALAALEGELGTESMVALVERFDELVPVLMHGDTEICHYHLDAARLDAVLAEIG